MVRASVIPTSLPNLTAGLKWIALNLALLILGFSLLSASPSLHHYWHHDDCPPDAACVINLFSSHAITLTDTATAIELRQPQRFAGAQISQSVLLDTRFGDLPPSRAPPSLRFQAQTLSYS